MSEAARPPLRQVRRLGRRTLERLGLFGPVFRLIERRISQIPPGERPPGDTLPLPPPTLITLVNSDPHYAWFSDQGRKESATLRELAAAHRVPFESAQTVVDFGCGCGRLARWLAPDVVAGGQRFVGLDINRELVGWCRANLPGDYRRIALRPPMPLADATVGALYAMSVLTHLKLRTAEAWLDDFARVLRPGGLAIVSFHDEDLAPAELKPRLEREPWVLNTQVLEGSNYMGSFVTRARFADICARRLEVLQVAPSQPAEGHQALAVLRKTR